MRTEDQYPSTYDLPHNDGGTGCLTDTIWGLLVNGRQRVREGWTSDFYIRPGGAATLASTRNNPYINGMRVCAIGGVLVADGLKDQPREPMFYYLEAQASEAVKQAIELLNCAALELYPGNLSDVNYCDLDDDAPIEPWYGPIEAVNQNRENLDEDEEVRKERVLRCYDWAIETRIDELRELNETSDHELEPALT